MPERPTWTYLHTRLHRMLRQRQLLEPQSRILVAVSGGQDSLCLLKLLLDLQPKWGWQVAIAHCDHQWCLDVGMAAHVEAIAQSWAIPFYLKTAVDLAQTEAAARQWRYQALTEIAQVDEYHKIVTGHTQSDRAETLLYNLIRGAGADGLQALTWRRLLAPNLELVRPLLEVSRAETGQFCQKFNLPIWEDAYNENLSYARNRIRQELIPYLQTHFNPQVETALAQTAELLTAEVEYLEKAAFQLQEEVIRDSYGGEPLALNRRLLAQAPMALKRRTIRQFLMLVLASAPSFAQIEEVTALLKAPNRSRTSPFPGGAIAQVEGDWIIIVTLQEAAT